MRKLIALTFALSAFFISKPLFAQITIADNKKDQPSPTEITPAPAVNTANPLTINVSLFPPFVMKDGNGNFSGYDIDLWREIAAFNNWQNFRFREVPRANRFSDLKNGQGDATMAGLTITSARENSVDFSLPYFDSGLLMMVKPEETSFLDEVLYWINSIGTMFLNILPLLIFYSLVVLLVAAIVWRLDFGDNSISDKFWPGFFESVWLVHVTGATVGYGDYSPKRWSSRVAMSIFIIIGIALFSMITGTIASTMVINRMETSINTPADLRGKPVATIADTASEEYVQSLGTILTSAETEEQAYDLLETDKIQAVVYDAPSLLYYLNGPGAGRAVIAGTIFDKQYYAIALPEGSRLREQLNRTLMRFRENGVLQNLNLKWFGKAEI